MAAMGIASGAKTMSSTLIAGLLRSPVTEAALEERAAARGAGGGGVGHFQPEGRLQDKWWVMLG